MVVFVWPKVRTLTRCCQIELLSFVDMESLTAVYWIYEVFTKYMSNGIIEKVS